MEADPLADLTAPLEGPPDVVRRRFEARYAVAADMFGALAGPDELDAAWDDYAAGRWHAVFVDPTPEHAIAAQRLVASIARLVAEPKADDWRWRSRLRARVDQLATLLLPVDPAAVDPDDEPPWRLVHVDEVRARFADALAAADGPDAG